MVNTIFPKAKHGELMKIIAFLINHKWSVFIITAIIFTVVILMIANEQPSDQELLQGNPTAEQQSKIEKFKSGKYHLSKGKTW